MSEQMQPRPDVRKHIVLTHPATNTQLTASLEFRQSDPFAVSLRLPNKDNMWTFSRDLLADGVAAEPGTTIGEGDIKLTTGGLSTKRLEIYLSTPEASSQLDTPLDPVEDFLKDTNTVVPPGTELDYYDIDEKIDLFRKGDL